MKKGAPSMELVVEPNIPDPDGFYEELVGSQRDLADDEAARMNARLVLLLANHIGDRAVLSAAIARARSDAK
jgi:hypothetical protein